MKGLGALSEAEGNKLSQAIGSLTINQPDEKLRSELKRIRVRYEGAKEKLREKFGLPSAEKSSPQTLNFDAQGNLIQ